MNQKTAWWQFARFGMFIHWGLYSEPGGIWKGEKVGTGGEWIMKGARIPIKEYEKIADHFNPKDFDANAIVGLAKSAGMKYLVYTAKHHDGFAMYHSACDSYNIVDRTPFGRDPMKELAEACKKENIIFCVYYSQYQDWHHPDASGNDWDFPAEKKKVFSRYLEEKAKPQLAEILQNYGSIGIIWFDTPYDMEESDCQKLVDCVHSFQPDCLISGRIGYRLGDYRQMSDNMIPVNRYETPWETPMTLNDTWGYQSFDHHWKSPEDVILRLVRTVGRGGNLLLNIGPDGSGQVPDASVGILKTVGEWLSKNGESIYGALAAPDFPYTLDWGAFTTNNRKLMMHVIQWPAFPYCIEVYGLKTPIIRASLLAHPQQELEIRQRYEKARDEYRFSIQLASGRSDPVDTVVQIELADQPEIYYF